MGWTTDREDQLKVLHKTGLSASQIARQLNCGFSRNAVIGKAHRMGLGPIGGGRASKPLTSRYHAKIQRPPKTAKPPKTNLGPLVHNMERKANAPDPGHVDAPEQPGTATILTLTLRTCRWPIGDPKHDDFSFCGCWTPDGATYCARHAAVAYQPAPRKASTRVVLHNSGSKKARVG